MSEKTIDPNLLGEKIVKELKQVFDPEIPVDVYELGLISVSYTHLTLPTILLV